MSPRVPSSLRSFSLLLLAGALAAQVPAPAPTPTPAAPAAPQKLFLVGASVTGGFKDGPLTGAKQQGDTVPLQTVLKAWVGDDGSTGAANTGRMLAMFTNPQKLGADQLAAAAKAKPDVLVAVDFPFWFAYGYVEGDEATARRERFAAGLDLLAKFECPVLVGDLPDMTGAARRMISPQQIPSRDVLGQLNTQLADFVKAHSNVHVVPLAAAVKTMKDTGVSLPLAKGPLQTAPGALLQEDRLHATRLGMAYLGYVLQEPLRAVMPKDHPLAQRKWTIEQFVAATGAEGDLEAMLAAGKPAERPAGK